jgi:hypothetical protein
MTDERTSSDDRRDEIETNYSRAPREQRSERRSICNIPARVAIEGDGGRRQAVVRNLSAIGAFLETEPMPVGTKIKLMLANAAVRSAQVVWLEDPGPSTRMRAVRGVGVRFLAMTRNTQP